MVRPVIEYANTVWSPYTKANIAMISVTGNFPVLQKCYTITQMDFPRTSGDFIYLFIYLLALQHTYNLICTIAMLQITCIAKYANGPLAYSASGRPEPIMLLKLPIMLLSNAPKISLLCSNYAQSCSIMP